ncbi:MAG: hypothetical protein V7707_14905 [Motiliproteus sp.]
MSAELIVLGVYLLAYCCLHSWLASLSCKQWVARRWPVQMHYYRLLFNLSAVLLLLPVALLLWRNAGPDLWQWQGLSAWLINGLALAAVLAFLYSLRDYDLSQFSGSAQLRNHTADRDPEGQAKLHIGWWHRRVRHPWYFFALVILWTRQMDMAHLLSYSIFTLYFVVGSRLEERKLKLQFGEAYRHYCHQVPGLIPLPWRSLSESQAQEIEQLANDFNSTNTNTNSDQQGV